MQGILAIDKPESFTSHDVVAITRRQTGMKKVGHLGTLDPIATGLLPIGIGKATKIMQYLDDEDKEYICTMRLGIRTDTFDIWGRILAETDHNTTIEEIKEAFASQTGNIMQVPPAFSAIKVKGKKLYEYARQGVDVEVSPRQVKINKIEILDVGTNEVTFMICCGRGTYIRSVCEDVGNILGCGAAMSALRRIKSAQIEISEAITIPELKRMSTGEIEEVLIPEQRLLSFPIVELTKKEARDIICGKMITCDMTNVKIEEKVTMRCGDIFIGVGIVAGQKIKADKIFNQEI